jgi:hypothetical protein
MIMINFFYQTSQYYTVWDASFKKYISTKKAMYEISVNIFSTYTTVDKKIPFIILFYFSLTTKNMFSKKKYNLFNFILDFPRFKIFNTF